MYTVIDKETFNIIGICTNGLQSHTVSGLISYLQWKLLLPSLKDTAQNAATCMQSPK